MINCKWLPALILLSDFDGNWSEYENTLYKYFCQDFIESSLVFNEKIVRIRKHPLVKGKEQTYFHITSEDYKDIKDRLPDLRRCERIRWPRKIIENYNCQETCENCKRIKIWNKPHNNTVRVHLLFEDYRYLVVLEKRRNFYLFITAFYIDKRHTLQKKLNEYETYKA